MGFFLFVLFRSVLKAFVITMSFLMLQRESDVTLL